LIIGRIPIDPKIIELQERGQPWLEILPQTVGFSELHHIIELIEEDTIKKSNLEI
jgi:hypothetical protein